MENGKNYVFLKDIRTNEKTKHQDMKKLTALLLAAALATGSALAQENPSWVRKNSISPDGTKIAFSYKGDIFVVPVTGGRALQITTNEAYDSEPLWKRARTSLSRPAKAERPRD